MKIVHVTAELYPYAKTGGLADVVGSLATTLADYGHEVSVFMPGYRAVFEYPGAIPSTHLLHLENDGGEVRSFSPRENFTVFLLCNNPLFDRSGIYGVNGDDFEDNHKRFLWFSKGVAEALRRLVLQADIVHCHDWQTAMVPMLLRYAELRHGVTLAKRTVFTIHNISFQGRFPTLTPDPAELPDETPGMQDLEHSGETNMLKGGLLFADQVTTVSPQYAKEIQTNAFGCGLDEVVARRAGRLVGLVNGIDPAVWNPATDIHLPAPYSADDMSGKVACRTELLKRLSLTPGSNAPIFGMVCRLTEQKGLDLLLANQDLFVGDCRLIILGAGERRYEEALKKLADTWPGTISFSKRFDEGLSHLVEAGSDFFVMPSLYEPCGLNQMYSQAYGTIPLASQVGGLLDTVIDSDDEPDDGTGITFSAVGKAFRDGVMRALTLYADKPRLAAVQRRGMLTDFSWAKAAVAYQELYTTSLERILPDENHGRAKTSAYRLMPVAS